ncbi:MAG: primosomal protein N', partial [bacterium]|nr:primosomal protein N' [bacterium]
RRGFSTYTQCLNCGEVIECPKCAIPLIYHLNSDSHKCHYCNYEIKGLDECPKCHADALQNFGAGSQRVEEIAAKIFKDAVIRRLDSDSLSKKNEHVEILNDFAEGKIDILVGTQMIAKGLDNPNVTLVGVINADLSFNLPDFRSTERGFSILTQVAGRSGRGENKGEVIFQTFNAENEFLLNAKHQDYKTFYQNEIEMREAFDYPPFSSIIRVILQSKNIFRAQRASMEIAMRLKDWIEKLSLTERLIVLGPVPCVIEKLKGDFRFNIIIKNKLTEKGHQTVLGFLRKVILPNDIKMIVDVDPTDVL